MEIVSRKEAKARGDKFYYTGKTCKRGHIRERWVSSERCVECARLSCKEFWDTHPEVKEAQYRRRVESGSMKEPQNKPEYKEWKKKYMVEYSKRNRGYYNAKNKEYNCMRMQATPEWADKDAITTVYTKAKELSDKWGIDLHVDHVYPLKSDWVCGLHTWENLQILSSGINCHKSNGRVTGGFEIGQ